MTNILLVGYSSKVRVTGMGLEFDMLISGLNARGIKPKVIDLGSVEFTKRTGSFNLNRVFGILGIISRHFMSMLFVDTCYITIASSRLGFLRDTFFIWVGRILRRRIIVHLKGGGYGEFYASQPSWFRQIVKLTLAQVNVIIVLGESLREQFSFVPDIERKIKIIPNGLPLQLVHDIALVKALSRSLPVRLLYLSNMITSKGYLDVLVACRILKERQIPFRCDFCGEFISVSNDFDALSPEQAQADFVNKIETWRLSDSVFYHGMVLGKKKQQYLMNAHIFLLPTYYPWEGQPISIIEALAFCTPVVATRHKGIPDQVIDGFNGLLIDKTSPEQISDAVQKLYEDPDFYSTLSENARKHFLANYTQEAHLREMFSVILGDRVD